MLLRSLSILIFDKPYLIGKRPKPKLLIAWHSCLFSYDIFPGMVCYIYLQDVEDLKSIEDPAPVDVTTLVSVLTKSLWNTEIKNFACSSN